MGKRDDWCSSKGLANRKKGMYEKESRGRKISYCMCFGFSAIFFFSAGGLYASRASNAAKINSDYTNGKLRSGTAPVVPKCDSKATTSPFADASALITEGLNSFGGDFDSSNTSQTDTIDFGELIAGFEEDFGGFSFDQADQFDTSNYYSNSYANSYSSGYEIENAYDGCNFPTFDVLGLNDPCAVKSPS